MERRARDVVWLGLTCAAVVCVHLSFAGRYGFFRDELYFIACGRHPSFEWLGQVYASIERVGTGPSSPA